MQIGAFGFRVWLWALGFIGLGFRVEGLGFGFRVDAFDRRFLL